MKSIFAKFYGKLLLMLAAILVTGVSTSQIPSEAQSQVAVDDDGTVHIPAFELPLSSYMSGAAKHSYIEQRLHPVPMDWGDDPVKVRATLDRAYHAPLLARAKALYPVSIEEKRIAGVRTDVVIPKEGVASKNRHRVLINLHGGGFSVGAGMGGQIESIPIAGVAKIKVISVDYREAPENVFPAASEDVAAVYKELLKEYKPENIGIYGCSAGGILTAMSIAWFQKEKLPRPGAIGIFCAADAVLGGDSVYMAAPLGPLLGSKMPPPAASPNPPPAALQYLRGVDLRSPLVSPTLHPDVLAQFPPTLLITGTRDHAGSSVIYAHSRLVRAGVEADLHVWEGMWHGFFFDPDLPESKEVFDIVSWFFDRHLGK